MSLVLKRWINGSRRLIYTPGISIRRGNIVEYTFNNGIESVTYSLVALASISSLPVEPNLSLFRVITPKQISIIEEQQLILLTMPGDIITITGKVKVNTGFGKVICADLDYSNITEVSYDISNVIMLTADTQVVNVVVPAYFQEKLRYDKLFCDRFSGTAMKINYLGLLFLGLQENMNLTVNLTFQDNFNYNVAGLFDLIFQWSFDYKNTNIITLCKDGNTYINGLTQTYALTSADIISFNVLKSSESDIITITELSS